jgi:hypothetical protein
LKRRPDLLEKAHLSETDKGILEELKREQGESSDLDSQTPDTD